MNKSGVFAFMFILFILVMPGVMADKVDYQIFDGKVLVEIELGEVSSWGYRLPYDVSALDVNVEYEIIGDFLTIDSGKDVKISYISESYVDEAEIRNFFVVNNRFDEVIDVRLFLDEGSILTENRNRLIVPDPSAFETDGRRVILRWDDFEGDEIIVDYEFIKGESYYWASVLFILALILLFYSIWKSKVQKRVGKVKGKKKLNRKGRLKKKKKELTTNLFGDEKGIVEYLLERKKNECWTKEIAKGLDISKVKLSRKLRNLEQKGLISRIPYGNENRIRLKK